MLYSIIKTIIRILFGLVGIISIVQSLAFLGLNFISPNDYPNHYQIKIFALYLVGEIILGLLCYFTPDDTPINDFLSINYQCAAFSSGYILISVLFKGFPDYTNLKNISSIALIILCATILGSYVKFQTNKSEAKKRRADWWR